ncbi:hypothetical protein THASP1DRAFT_33572 [Thamnocephalis sphaerospora]|uniref:Uncharacterized protein n=1 Tax=Thamnocephalis sphaerospora TaxID=78915 RepID=A0A4P9XGA2_9FUNG|nr:hypothetical protein THASP1DRAFT_33572 [Thamnocephalis sphaerospora]|eukprot:RKP04637.1 hypothetical protein THASP1DRAFT_33572 [Thamnocephalis sphaerospora]
MGPQRSLALNACDALAFVVRRGAVTSAFPFLAVPTLLVSQQLFYVVANLRQEGRY